jgi:hypothetical protein
MSYPATFGDGKPPPTLLSPGTARSIGDGLIDAERAEFERRFAEEMDNGVFVRRRAAALRIVPLGRCGGCG